MVIIRDLSGKIVGKMASESYVPTRKLRKAKEDALCRKALGIEEPAQEPNAIIHLSGSGNVTSLVTGETYSVKACGCEDWPCCGH